MNHSFIASQADSSLCANCHYPEVAHTNSAQCESCANVGPCEIVSDILMCASCQKRDAEIQNELNPANIADPRERRITELKNQLSKEIPVDSRAYFVSEVTQIVDIENQLREAGIDNPQYKAAEIIEERIKSFRANLFEVKKMELELKMSMITDQKYLNQLVPKLREEERAKFKDYDISYQPKAVVATSSRASGPRMSASERALESYAKMMGISVEQAKRVLESATKNTMNISCTCAETPGVCKVHPK